MLDEPVVRRLSRLVRFITRRLTGYNNNPLDGNLHYLAVFAIIEPGVEKTINEKDRSTESPPERLGADHGDAVGVVLRTGGVFAFIAAALILRMARQHAALLSS